MAPLQRHRFSPSGGPEMKKKWRRSRKDPLRAQAVTIVGGHLSVGSEALEAPSVGGIAPAAGLAAVAGRAGGRRRLADQAGVVHRAPAGAEETALAAGIALAFATHRRGAGQGGGGARRGRSWGAAAVEDAAVGLKADPADGSVGALDALA